MKINTDNKKLNIKSSMIKAFVVLLLAFGHCAHSENLLSSEASTDMFYDSLSRLAVAMFVLICLLLAAWFLIKHSPFFPRFKTGEARRIKLIESMALGSKERVVLLEVDGACLLVGVSQTGINLLQGSSSSSKTDFDHALCSARSEIEK